MEEHFWRRFFDFYVEFWRVLREKTHAKHCAPHYFRIQLSIHCIFPTKEQRKSPYRRAFNLFALVFIELFLLTLILALPDIQDSVVDLGQQWLWIVATFYMAFKYHYYYFNSFKIDEVIDALDACHLEAPCEEFEQEVREIQLSFFLLESGLGFLWHFVVYFFIILALTQPVWTNQKLPFYAWYPFEWGNPDKHPTAHVFMYIWQVVFLTYNCSCILFSELFSVHCFTQIAANLKILTTQLNKIGKMYQNDVQKYRQELGRLVAFHQRIIAIADIANEEFNALMIMQMINIYVMISLAAFLTLICRHEPIVAARFVFFMLMAFLHFSYFCYFGEMLSTYAVDVGHAAYNTYLWSPQSRELQRDLMFIITRAQRPICVEPSPFPAFNLITYMIGLKQCYTLLTVLLESME